jgi:predicted Rossmann fold nucleotide-binding protein DprA/Smf involved in DNA uptake
MVDKSDYVVAVWNGKPSGTSDTIKYARKQNKTIYCIDAVTFKMREI